MSVEPDRLSISSVKPRTASTWTFTVPMESARALTLRRPSCTSAECDSSWLQSDADPRPAPADCIYASAAAPSSRIAAITATNLKVVDVSAVLAIFTNSELFLFGCRLQEQVAFDEIEQVDDWPRVLAALVGSRQEPVATHDSLGPGVCKFVIHETAKPEHLVDDKTG